MKKTNNTKLKLAVDTIKTLSTCELQDVAGGQVLSKHMAGCPQGVNSPLANWQGQ